MSKYVVQKPNGSLLSDKFYIAQSKEEVVDQLLIDRPELEVISKDILARRVVLT